MVRLEQHSHGHQGEAGVKIITPGNLPQNDVFKATCSSCQAVYEFARHEARLSTDQRDGDALITKCPQAGCGHENWINPNPHKGSQWDR